MRVNVYAEEMTDRVELVEKKGENGKIFTGIRFYLYLPVTHEIKENEPNRQIQGPFIHHKNDDDSAAITFWGKKTLHKMLIKALALIEEQEEKRHAARSNSATHQPGNTTAPGKKLTMKDIETAISPYRMSGKSGQTTIGIKIFKETINLAEIYQPPEINRLIRLLQFELVEWCKPLWLEQEPLSPTEDPQCDKEDPNQEITTTK